MAAVDGSRASHCRTSFQTRLRGCPARSCEQGFSRMAAQIFRQTISCPSTAQAAHQRTARSRFRPLERRSRMGVEGRQGQHPPAFQQQKQDGAAQAETQGDKAFNAPDDKTAVAAPPEGTGEQEDERQGLHGPETVSGQIMPFRHRSGTSGRSGVRRPPK